MYEVITQTIGALIAVFSIHHDTLWSPVLCKQGQVRRVISADGLVMRSLVVSDTTPWAVVEEIRFISHRHGRDTVVQGFDAGACGCRSRLGCVIGKAQLGTSRHLGVLSYPALLLNQPRTCVEK